MVGAAKAEELPTDVPLARRVPQVSNTFITN